MWPLEKRVMPNLSASTTRPSWSVEMVSHAHQKRASCMCSWRLSKKHGVAEKAACRWATNWLSGCDAASCEGSGGGSTRQAIERSRGCSRVMRCISRHALRRLVPEGLTASHEARIERPLTMAKSMRESVRVRVENEGVTSARKMLSVRPQPLRRLRFEQRTRLPRRTISLDVSAYPRSHPCPLSVPRAAQCGHA